MNNFILHWKRLKKFKSKHYTVVEDRPYSLTQLKTLVDAATLRDKCMILIMCSAGLRRGALAHLRIRDLQRILQIPVIPDIRIQERTRTVHHFLYSRMCQVYGPISRVATKDRRATKTYFATL